MSGIFGSVDCLLWLTPYKRRPLGGWFTCIWCIWRRKSEWNRRESTKDCQPPRPGPPTGRTMVTHHDQTGRHFFTGNCSGPFSMTRGWLYLSPQIFGPLPQTLACDVSVFFLSFANLLKVFSPVSSNDLVFGETLSLSTCLGFTFQAASLCCTYLFPR